MNFIFVFGNVVILLAITLKIFSLNLPSPPKKAACLRCAYTWLFFVPRTARAVCFSYLCNVVDLAMEGLGETRGPDQQCIIHAAFSSASAMIRRYINRLIIIQQLKTTLFGAGRLLSSPTCFMYQYF